MRQIVGLVFITVFMAFSLSYAVFGDTDIPIPNQTKELDSRNIEIAQTERKISVYRTSLSAEQVLQFYQEQMPKRGWSEDTSFSRTLKAVEFPDGMRGKEAATAMLHNTLKFKKNNYAMMVNIMPSPTSTNFTLFTVSYGKEPPSAYTDLQPAKPMDFAPVYPGAKHLFSGNNIYVYTTQAQISEVASFYKLNLLNYGWTFAEEIPLTVSKAPAGMGGSLGQADNCPDCEKKDMAGISRENIPDDIKDRFQEMLENISVLRAGLKYKKYSGQTIDLDFIQPQSTSLGLGTQITIRLNEK